MTPAVIEEAPAKVIVVPDEKQLIREEVSRVDYLLDKYQGNANYEPPTSTYNWVTHCYEVHRDLIEKWGGWRWHGTPVVANVVDTDVRRNANTRAWERVLVKSTEEERITLLNAGLPRIDWHSPLFELRHARETVQERVAGGTFSNNIQVPVRKGQSVARAVLRHIRREYSEYPTYIKYWEAFFEEMGQAWASTKHELAITLSCAPSSFLRLGHYGENNSCYQMGFLWEVAKYNLAIIPNSVVLLAYDGDNLSTPPPNTQPRIGSVSARAWGVVDPDGGATFANLYNSYWERLYPVLNKSFPEALGQENITFTSEDDEDSPFYGLESDALLYLNEDQVIVYSDNTSPTQVRENIMGSIRDMDWDMIVLRQLCANCEEHSIDNNICRDCHNLFCTHCTNYCQACDEHYCGNCRSVEDSCSSCWDNLCSECVVVCEGCYEDYCRACASIKHCSDCGYEYCEQCERSCSECDEHGLCRDCDTCISCQEELEDDEDNG